MAQHIIIAADDDGLFNALLKRPDIAWPTVFLFLAAALLYGVGVYAGIQGWWHIGISIALNALATFWFFTVFHDASHNALSLRRGLNDWLGRISIFPMTPLPMFRAFRFIHMQHHRFANEGGDKDPDGWCGEGVWWSLPFRWATLDCKYYVWYLPKLMQRPMSERIDIVVSTTVSLSVIALLIAFGYWKMLFLLWFFPSRIAIFFLALAFDYLPHWPYKVAESVNKYQATSVRVGYEKVLTPLLLSQNYYLVHHLYPLVPFYRYVSIWRARERFHLAQSPLLVDVFSRELETPRYLAIRNCAL